MTSLTLLDALGQVAAVLEALGVRYYVGGSVASSARGVPRSSLDADVVAELSGEHVAAFVERLADGWYLDEGRIAAAVRQRRSFNLIHLESLFKIDVFVSKGRPFDGAVLERATPERLAGPATAPLRVATAEDIVLVKLAWFRSGGEVSERQWTDVLGVLRARGAALDEAYLRLWAASLGVADLLERALQERAA